MLERTVAVSQDSHIGLAMGWCGRRLLEDRWIDKIVGFGDCRVGRRTGGSIGLPFDRGNHHKRVYSSLNPRLLVLLVAVISCCLEIVASKKREELDELFGQDRVVMTRQNR